MASREKLQSREARRLWALRRSLFRLAGPGFVIDELDDGTFGLRRPQDPRHLGTVRSWVTRSYQRR